MIPKIIHQIGPEDNVKWHPVWKDCHKTWKNIFLDYEIIFWNDSEDIDNFIKEKYPDKFNFYNQLPFHMMKMDFVRYAILNYYGGIYADLDVYCYENFYNDLTGKICLIEPIIFADNDHEMIMGCLMASQPQQVFWQECMNTCQSLFFQSKIDSNDVYEMSNQVLDITGPRLLNMVYNSSSQREDIQLLSKENYHPSPLDYHSGMKTKHMKTITWGKESISSLENVFNNLNVDYETGMKMMFRDIRGIDIESYDYKRQYD